MQTNRAFSQNKFIKEKERQKQIYDKAYWWINCFRSTVVDYTAPSTWLTPIRRTPNVHKAQLVDPYTTQVATPYDAGFRTKVSTKSPLSWRGIAQAHKEGAFMQRQMTYDDTMTNYSRYVDNLQEKAISRAGSPIKDLSYYTHSQRILKKDDMFKSESPKAKFTLRNSPKKLSVMTVIESKTIVNDFGQEKLAQSAAKKTFTEKKKEQLQPKLLLDNQYYPQINNNYESHQGNQQPANIQHGHRNSQVSTVSKSDLSRIEVVKSKPKISFWTPALISEYSKIPLPVDPRMYVQQFGTKQPSAQEEAQFVSKYLDQILQKYNSIRGKSLYDLEQDFQNSQAYAKQNGEVAMTFDQFEEIRFEIEWNLSIQLFDEVNQYCDQNKHINLFGLSIEEAIAVVRQKMEEIKKAMNEEYLIFQIVFTGDHLIRVSQNKVQNLIVDLIKNELNLSHHYIPQKNLILVKITSSPF